MPVSAGTVQFSYTGDGTTTVFPFPSRFLSNADIIVGVNGALVASGFVTTGQGEETGGTVTFDVAPPNGQAVTLIRAPAISQLLDFVNNQTVLAENIDNGLDKLTIIAQYLNYLIERTIRLSQFDTGLTGNFDALGRRIGNVAAPVDNADVARLIDIQSIVAAAGSVPLPTGGQIGYVLQAISAGVFGWQATGAVQPLNANLTAESGLNGAADKLSYYTGLGAKALTDFTSLGRATVKATATITLTPGTDARGQAPIAATARLVAISTVGSIGGVTLPAGVAGENGREVIIFTPADSTTFVNVYCATANLFFGLADGTPVSVLPGYILRCVQRATGVWNFTLRPTELRRRILAGGYGGLSDLELPSISWVDGFVALRGKGRVLLATRTAVSSATLDFTEFNAGLYRAYDFEIERLLPATDGANLNARTSTNGGSTYDAGASDYYQTGYAMQGLSGPSNDGTAGAAAWKLNGGATGIGNTAGRLGLSGKLHMLNPGDTGGYASISGKTWNRNTANTLHTLETVGERLVAQDADAIRFLMSSGNITSGVIRMYGWPV